jgi:hypothetical protein
MKGTSIDHVARIVTASSLASPDLTYGERAVLNRRSAVRSMHAYHTALSAKRDLVEKANEEPRCILRRSRPEHEVYMLYIVVQVQLESRAASTTLKRNNGENAPGAWP